MAYEDWQPMMDEVVEKYSPKTILEFGLGIGTFYLLKNFEAVTSIELLANPEHEGWFEKVKEEAEARGGWKGYLIRCTDGDPESQVKAMCASHMVRINPDIVFVDPGVHFRGYLVNLAMQKEIPLIMAHDTRRGDDEGKDLYGWKTINPEGYESQTRHEGEGTTLWRKI